MLALVRCAVSRFFRLGCVGAETTVTLFEEKNGMGKDVRGHSGFLIGEGSFLFRFWRVASSHAAIPRDRRATLRVTRCDKLKYTDSALYTDAHTYV